MGNSPSPIIVPPKVSYRGWESMYAMPDLKELADLGPTIPYAFPVFDSIDEFGILNPVGGGQTVYGNTTQEEDCWIWCLTGSIYNTTTHTLAGNFSVMFYDAQREKLWMPQPINFGSSLGSAQKPFLLRKPYKMPASGELKAQVLNLAAFPAHIQVIAWGLRPDSWHPVNSKPSGAV
jgi:hypothetical protein